MEFKIKYVILFSFIYLFQLITSKDKTMKLVNLWESEECKNEILQHCKEEKNKSNSILINCLQQSPEVIRSLTNNCQHYLWNYKLNYLDVEFFNFITHDDCKAELSKFNNCDTLNGGDNVICLIKHKPEITNSICLSQLNEVATIVFSDIMVVNKFLSHCSENIKELQCGRLESDFKLFSTENFISRLTSQGKTIECLIESLQKLRTECRKQILRLGELQSDDFHLNPSLYYSCREERESLCKSVEAGSSRIYNCLEKKKFNALMSANCRNALRYKHQLESQDYKIRNTFSDKCSKDIYDHKCITSVKGDQIANLTSVILCLLKNENKESLSQICRSEIKAVRSQMAQNIDMFPDIKNNCAKEIERNCKDIKPNAQGDTVIHCLMRNSMPALRLEFNKKCLTSLNNYIKTIDPTEDIQQLDPLISQVCSNELSQQCNAGNYIEANDRYECLLKLIDEDQTHKEIGEDCKSHLLTLAHFVEQDYSLNHKLFKMCHEDAVKFCGKQKSVDQSSSLVPQAVLHCLLRRWNNQYINNEQSFISYKCTSELKTVMKIEASNIMLNFKVYTACSMDLVKTCKTNKEKMDCLQLNYESLSPACKVSISKFLSLDAEEYSLKKLITRSCSAMVKKFCKDQEANKKKDFMECLVVHKLDKDMDNHCKIAIEHYQIIGLENYKIDHKFARFCSKEIQNFCSQLLDSKQKQNEDEIENEVTKKTEISKAEVVACLSRHLTRGLLKKKNPFSSQCYEQFTFEFLQTTDSLNLDPELTKMCQAEIVKWCSDAPANGISCLLRYQDNLNEQCLNLLVSRQQLGALDSRFDVGIQRNCREMISTYCKNVPSFKVFRCLHKNMRIEGFNVECKLRVHRRLERRLVDLRLNPELLDNCKDEIRIHCNISNIEDRISNMKSHNKYQVINCLRDVFVEHRKFLGSFCRRLVYDIVLDANSNIHLDPGLYDVCQNEIKQKCSDPLIENKVAAEGSVQDCLKHNLLLGNLQENKCNQEVYRLLREGLADVHVDPQLYSSCQNEISRICLTETLGHGRKLSCLLWAMEDKKMTTFLSTGCKSVLQERKQMWEFATKMEAPKNVKEVFELVYESDSRYYLLSIFMMAFLFIMLLGIMFGRFSRRQAKTLIRNRK